MIIANPLDMIPMQNLTHHHVVVTESVFLYKLSFFFCEMEPSEISSPFTLV